jgi:hypothetical protein
MERLDVSDKKVLVLTDGVKPNVFLSGRNIPNVHVMPYTDSSTYHILWSDVVLIEAGAVGASLSPIAEEASAPVAKKSKAASPANSSAATKKTAKVAKKAAKTEAKSAKSAKKAAAKPAAKKSAAKKSTKKKGK